MFQIRQAAQRVAISKHRQFDPETGKHLPGRCRIADNSSLRKLMRAQRRGAVPVERIRVCIEAQKSAIERAPLYMNAHACRAAGYVRDLDGSFYMPASSVALVAPTQSKVYSVKSNAARAAAKHGLDRDHVFAVEGGFAFHVPA